MLRSPSSTGISDYKSLVLGSVLARLPYGMGAAGVLTYAAGRGFTSEQVGLITAAWTVGLAVASPAWGRGVDRSGLAVPFLGALCLNLVGTCLLIGSPGPLLVTLGAVLLGAGLPPVGAVMRTAWTTLITTEAGRDRASVFESVLAELVHIVGRVVIAVVATWSTLVIAPLQLALLLLGCGLLVRDPHLRTVHLVRQASYGGSTGRLLAPGVGLVLASASFMAVSHGCMATALVLTGDAYAGPAMGAVLMTLWALGSIVGGSWRFRRVSSARPADLPRTVLLGLLVFAVAAGLCAAASGAGWRVLAVTVVVAGLPLAPTMAAQYQLLAAVATPSRLTQTFTAYSTTIVLGFGVGSSVVGVLGGLGSSGHLGFGAASATACAAVVIWAAGRPGRAGTEGGGAPRDTSGHTEEGSPTGGNPAVRGE